MFKAGLVGVTGYTGMELARILAGHAQMRLTMATSRSESGRLLSDLYPFLRGLPGVDVTVTNSGPREIAAQCDVVFLAVPHGVSMETAAAVLKAADELGKSVKVVDLSADFRLEDPHVFSEWYKVPHTHPELLSEAVYGLPELNAEKIRKARLVANPGCYPTASILGLYAALKNGLIEPDSVIIDAKSGVTGSGRKASVPSLFCEVTDTFRAYSIGGRHRHTPEIEQEMGKIAGTPVAVSFNPHLVPMRRGILATIYAKLKGKADASAMQDIYEAAWKDERFVRVLPAGQLPECRFVRGSMFCDMAVTIDERTRRLIVVSVIDNLCRGASGQAVANANLVLGLSAWEGLEAVPMVP
ncbi:MAG: N-acetyl-gamma-glutamyl-phosphate reductase [Mailhella sp.]|nr:N-acetyl-gamma-glutamyl-phosphate reductase [Mailhella sp.]